jgi:NAD(P)H dehydrogenase (quinone)
MKIAITGATGQLGGLAIKTLGKKLPTEQIVALARDPAKGANLGVEVRPADYRKPETLVPALRGITRLVLISSGDFDARFAQHLNVIRAAHEAGVGHIVYTSILKGHASPMAIAEDHKETEKAIAATGIPATILRNGWYTENHTGSLGGALAAGAMIGSAGNGRLSSAARADYADAIAAVAAGKGHEGKTYELAGDNAHTMADIAAEVSRLTGRTIPYNSMPMEAYAGILKSFGLPEGFAFMLADADARAAEGALFDDSGTLGRLIGRPTTPVADTVAMAVSALAA